MATEIIYLNGEFMPLEEARIPVLDRGFIFGDGVYEVIPVYSRHPFRLPEHLKRSGPGSLTISLRATRATISRYICRSRAASPSAPTSSLAT